ncbi:MAG TPA: polysaccharide deacetylase family protein [Planctomycetota bacterium]|nr:polysaccharide deacetylase family protein [Planctomycetota bacterium]
MDAPAAAVSDGFMLSVDVEPDWGAPCAPGAPQAGLDEGLPWLLDALERHGARATFFVVGGLAEAFARLCPPGAAHEVGAHGLTHRRLSQLDAAELDAELCGARARLQAAGFRVEGFRAPFFDAPPDLGARLARAGYRYDASEGGLMPSAANRPHAPRAASRGEVVRLSGDALRVLRAPANLTWLRLLDPCGVALLPARPRHFLLHLHELVPAASGLSALPWPLRRLHARGAGPPARALVEDVLRRARDAGQDFVTGRELAASARAA